MRTSETAQLIRAFTGGSMDVEHLRGPGMATARMELMTKLTGTNVSYEISNLYEALFELFGIDGIRHVDMQSKLIERLNDALPFKYEKVEA